MKGKKKIAIAWCIAFVAVCISAQVYGAKTTEEKIQDAKKEATEQKEKLNDANETIDKLEDSKAQLEGSLSALNSKLEQLSDEMTELEERLDTKQQEISKTEEELAAAALVEQEQYESMKMRIKYLYELGGDDSMFQMMLEEKDFAKILNKADYYSKITEYDRKALEEYQETKNQIATAKQELENDRIYIESLISQKEDKQAEIQSLVNVRNH